MRNEYQLGLSPVLRPPTGTAMLDICPSDRGIDRDISIAAEPMPQIANGHQSQSSHNSYAFAASLINLPATRRLLLRPDRENYYQMLTMGLGKF